MDSFNHSISSSKRSLTAHQPAHEPQKEWQRQLPSTSSLSGVVESPVHETLSVAAASPAIYLTHLYALGWTAPWRRAGNAEKVHFKWLLHLICSFSVQSKLFCVSSWLGSTKYVGCHCWPGFLKLEVLLGHHFGIRHVSQQCSCLLGWSLRDFISSDLTSHVESQGPPAMVVPLQASNTRTMSVDLEEAQGLPSSILRLLCWTREGLPKPPKPKHCTLNQGGMKEQIWKTFFNKEKDSHRTWVKKKHP